MTARVLFAAFQTPDDAAVAIRALLDAGHRVREAYSPLSDEKLMEEIPARQDLVRPAMVVDAVVGIAAGLGMQFWSATIGYPINSGGRALGSWPAFVLVTFELGVVFAAVAGFIAMFFEAGLTRLHAPQFEVEGFERTSRDRVLVEFETVNVKGARNILGRAGAVGITEAPQ